MKLYCAVSSVVAEALMDKGMTATVFANDYYGMHDRVVDEWASLVVVLRPLEV